GGCAARRGPLSPGTVPRRRHRRETCSALGDQCDLRRPSWKQTRGAIMNIGREIRLGLSAAFVSLMAANAPAVAQQQKPNIVMIVSDDFGYGDSAPYGGGPGRGLPTPSPRPLANQRTPVFPFYCQPSLHPARA